MQIPAHRLAPCARASAPMASATDRSRSGSQVAARAMATGNAVEDPSATPRGPSVNRMPGMPNRSIRPASNGTLLYRWDISRMPRRIVRSPSRSHNNSRSVSRPIRAATASSRCCRPLRTLATAAAKAVSGGQIGSVTVIGGPDLTARRSGAAGAPSGDEGPHPDGEIDHRQDGGGGLGEDGARAFGGAVERRGQLQQRTRGAQ